MDQGSTRSSWTLWCFGLLLWPTLLRPARAWLLGPAPAFRLHRPCSTELQTWLLACLLPRRVKVQRFLGVSSNHLGPSMLFSRRTLSQVRPPRQEIHRDTSSTPLVMHQYDRLGNDGLLVYACSKAYARVGCGRVQTPCSTPAPLHM
ncbi:hypothetical protein EV356DRAFT_54100 [Viridothelium virens]|uniref:Uncharacterized protein n=1 Tax=Viridothelium virens TaxID=1048519 RepID=A0A6A6HG35_VIRVR|nr:hypothetical protein EV356DRAFT_54100 [Viridothelium virens]